MDQHMGRRTVSGLLFTRGGSILVYREENSRDTIIKCCNRIRCSGKYPESNCRSLNSNSLGHDSRQRDTENSLYPLKRRVNSRRKSLLSAERPPSTRRSTCSSPTASNSGSSNSSISSSSRSVPEHSMHWQFSRSRNKTIGKNTVSVNAHTDSGKRTRRASENIEESILPEPRIGQLLPRDGSFASQISPLAFSEDRRIMGGRAECLLGLERRSSWDDHSFPDQHRGMRMDIDDMSYEELLALGERIGVVSTGLSEETLSECLKRGLYEPTSSISGTIDAENGGAKCIICQEYYGAGDEVGEMACKHHYHWTCIDQWLRLKNWCPICRASAAPAS